jgi:hypothetical protein
MGSAASSRLRMCRNDPGRKACGLEHPTGFRTSLEGDIRGLETAGEQLRPAILDVEASVGP